LTDNSNAEKSVEIGVIGRPHGVKGAFRLFLHNPSSNILQKGKSVRIVFAKDGAHPSERRIAAVQRSGKHCVIALDGVDRRELAEQLTGARLHVLRSELPDLDENEFYVEDLLGLEVWENEKRLGAIVGSRDQAGVEVLFVVEGEVEIEMPLIDDFIVHIDLAGRRLEVRDTGDLPRSVHRTRSSEGV
jgi:16S rRNA processing protein RimM